MNVREISSYLDLDSKNLQSYNKDDIKQNYKKIALECHPDKLAKITDDEEKQKRIDKFKNATLAYRQCLQDFQKYGKILCNDSDDFNFKDIGGFGGFREDFEVFKNFDFGFWQDAFSTIQNNKSNISDTFRDLASFLLKKNLKPQSFYNPSVTVIRHNIMLPVSYHDMHTSKKKKVRVILKGIDEPLFLNIVCKKEYPEFTKQYIDDDGIEHEINVKMKILQDSYDNYSHILEDSGIINLITNINITLSEYLSGCKKDVEYINGKSLTIDIPAFSLERMTVEGKGLLGGDLIIYLGMTNIQKDKWDLMNIDDKTVFMSLLKCIQ